MLISFEGLDNCGKTTIVGKLKKYYDGLNILTDFTREFETNIGREIKEMSKAGVLDPVLKTYLFAADRYIRTKIYEEDYNRNLLGGLYRENPVKSRNYEAVKSSKKWENVGNSYIIPALLLYRYSYI